jgi:23S rRNA pseudouridine1911/1915/1917 synthase
MPAPITVTQPAKLLEQLFAAWPDLKKKQIRTWLKFQAVLVNGRPVTQFDHPLFPGDVVAVRSDPHAIPQKMPGADVKIWFEDSQLLVIDKPTGLLSTANTGEQMKTVYTQLCDYLQTPSGGQGRVFVVHRLDKETSGLMVFTKTNEAKEKILSTWDETEKIYEAVVEGRLPALEGVFESYLDETNPFKVYPVTRSGLGSHALTHYRTLITLGRRSLIELTLRQVCRHQIRFHLAQAGCPVIGDEKYGAKTDPLGRLGLHACQLRFPHPKTGKELQFLSPLPKELVKLV